MHPDHVTIVVRELEEASAFFKLLDFEVVKSVEIRGPVFSQYMDVPDLEADHITLVLKGHSPRFEIQLLHYKNPAPHVDPHAYDLCKTGYNHLCFAVTNLDERITHLKAAGVELRSQVLEFHDRKLVFVRGPEDITVELAQWTDSS
ncbi:Glyoxalase-like domain protein [Pseudovibrio axinellae]|uniref:Glyoxalase-like domain protein n=1 Tax=Pseudovibrio axinellae TaxID=989403 RepID=A0A161V953_9HYPH|nr:VOC family protein [Pseudovibrio axinellae]KZL15753.1 Glyoxalase-like domain protein [Pseudovibrio axinellae]SEQ63110.1 Catechol 2,3-dioxygenase [Pseudovibrio axinellae]